MRHIVIQDDTIQNKIKVGYLSDLHLDSYFGSFIPTGDDLFNSNQLAYKEEKINKFIDDVFFKASKTKQENETFDVLIVAGDLSHQNKLTVLFFEILKKRLPWLKYVLFVFGNHCLYLLNASDGQLFKTGRARIKDAKKKLEKIPGIFCLDGDIVEINGVKFGGCQMWYDGKMAEDFFATSSEKIEHEDIVEITDWLWSNTIADDMYIPDKKTYTTWFTEEYKKLKNVAPFSDVLITHIHPVSESKYLDKKYRKISTRLLHILKEKIGFSFKSKQNPTNGFFTFDSTEIRKMTPAKFWVFGHVHDKIKFKKDGITFCANQVGYPKESSYAEMTDIEIFEIKIPKK